MVRKDSSDRYNALFDYINFNNTFFSNLNESSIIHDYGVTTTFLRGTGTLLLRAGLILIQFGCVPSTNVNMIILQNVIDLSCATIAFATLGYMLAFGNDLSGVIGWTGWILDDTAHFDNAILGWSCIITATGIYITMVAGRMFWFGNLIISTTMAAVIIPIVMHWMWTSSGWMHRTRFHRNLVSYKDYGGGMIIHVCGGIVALMGSLFLGRRLLRLQDIGDASLPPGSPASVTVGYLLVIIGLMGECLPTLDYELNHEPYNFIGATFFNNILAAAGGIITVVFLQACISQELSQFWSLVQYMQGAIAGVVIIASGVDVYTPIVALALGILGAFMYYWVAYLMFHLSVEDNVNITATHLSCGFLGTLIPPLCGVREGFGVPHNMAIHFTWQLICDLAILGFVTIIALILFCIVCNLNLLRDKDEEANHNRAMVILRQNPHRFCRRLLGLGPLLQPEYRFKNKDYESDLYATVGQTVINPIYKQQDISEVNSSSSSPSPELQHILTEHNTTKSKLQNTSQNKNFTKEKEDAYPSSSKFQSVITQNISPKLDSQITAHNIKNTDGKGQRLVTFLSSLKMNNNSGESSSSEMDLHSITYNTELPGKVNGSKMIETSPRIKAISLEENSSAKELENKKYPDEKKMAYQVSMTETTPKQHNTSQMEFQTSSCNTEFLDTQTRPHALSPTSRIQSVPVDDNSPRMEFQTGQRNVKFRDGRKSHVVTHPQAHSSRIQSVPVDDNSPRMEFQMGPRNMKYHKRREATAVTHSPPRSSRIQSVPMQHNDPRMEFQMEGRKKPRNTKDRDAE